MKSFPEGPDASTTTHDGDELPAVDRLTSRQREILEFIVRSVEERGYPPSVREIGTEVGLTSPSTVHSHLATLQRLGFLRRDPTKPRAIEVHNDSISGTSVFAGGNVERRPVRHIPLIGDVAAGTGVLAEENVQEVLPVPADLTGEGELFMLKVRGDSMIDVGILDGDLVVVSAGSETRTGDIVVAGIPGEEATVKELRRSGDGITLVPHNPRLQPMVFRPDEVTIFGRVVTVLRKL